MVDRCSEEKIERKVRSGSATSDKRSLDTSVRVYGCDTAQQHTDGHQDTDGVRSLSKRVVPALRQKEDIRRLRELPDGEVGGVKGTAWSPATFRCQRMTFLYRIA
jgi:hypothetical protein